jgi:hypothetical protein
MSVLKLLFFESQTVADVDKSLSRNAEKRSVMGGGDGEGSIHGDAELAKPVVLT